MKGVDPVMMLVDVSTAWDDFMRGYPRKRHRWWAVLDTGAQWTSIPLALAERLELTPTGKQDAIGAGGRATLPTFLVDLQPFSPRGGKLRLRTNHPIMGSRAQKIFIGRDLLASMIVTWNGPAKTVDVVEP